MACLRKQLYMRSLCSDMLTNHAARRNTEGQVLDEHSVPVGLGQAGHFHDLAAQAGRLGDGDGIQLRCACVLLCLQWYKQCVRL